MWYRTPSESISGDFKGKRFKVGRDGELVSTEIDGGLILPSVYTQEVEERMEEGEGFESVLLLHFYT